LCAIFILIGCSEGISQSKHEDSMVSQFCTGGGPSIFLVCDGELIYEPKGAPQQVFVSKLCCAFGKCLSNSESVPQTTAPDGGEFTILCQFGKTPLRIVIIDAANGVIWVEGVRYNGKTADLQPFLSPTVLKKNLSYEAGEII
jgi:hypothetical protein